jgi:WD40-like Beta Propeller Repeat
MEGKRRNGAHLNRGVLAYLCFVGMVAIVSPGAPAGAAACPNEAFRVGASANLPACRAYELVTPRYTGGLRPTAVSFSTQVRHAFEMPLISPDSSSVLFQTIGGALSGSPGTGNVDRYLARRGDGGWATEFIGPTAAQTEQPNVGQITPGHDHYLFDAGFALVNVTDHGSLVSEHGPESSFLHEPDGSVELLATGSLGSDPTATGYYMSPGATHIIFSTRGSGAGEIQVQLEPAAPATGTPALYDRSADGPTEVVSLLPGDLTPSAPSSFQGASADGSAVLFATPATIDGGTTGESVFYVRVDDDETHEVVSNLDVGSDAYDCSSTTAAEQKNFQWLRNGMPIPGATSASYTVGPADAGSVIQCQVFARNSNAGSTQVSNPGIVIAPAPATAPPVAPTNINAPAQSATLAVGGAGGQTLTCNPGTWTGAPTFTYQWYRNGFAIPGATASTYVVTEPDVATPAVFQCAATGTNAGGSVVKVSRHRATSPAPEPAAPGGNGITGQANATATNASVIPAGLSADGEHVFYVAAGNVYAFNTVSQATQQIVPTGDALLVNISDDGSRVYFVSRQQIGGEGTAGEPNLYIWDRASSGTSFVATVGEGDLAGYPGFTPAPKLTGWTEFVAKPKGSTSGNADAAAGANLSRATSDGSVLVFESVAQLTAYDNAGHREVYRYDALADELDCVSCGPGIGPATAEASLQSFRILGLTVPLSSLQPTPNVTDDGQKVFFQTREQLAPADVNARQDVYEWVAGGIGGCQQPEGCIGLLSSGKSTYDDYLYTASSNGSDVLFQTNERLLPSDENGGVGAIYDARAGGGFSELDEGQAGCVEDACQGSSQPPVLAPVGSSILAGRGNPTVRRPRARCPKGKRKVRRGGRTRCVKHRRDQRKRVTGRPGKREQRRAR